MNDMRAVIVPKSDQINADDLIAGPITITITSVSIRPGTEQPVSIFFDGDNGKPYKCCKIMARVMVDCWGPDANEYVGRSMTLYRDPKVLWGGMAVGGIRISHMSHIDGARTMALTMTKGSKKPFTVKPLAQVPESAKGASSPKEENGGAFLRRLTKALAKCKSGEEVLGIGGHATFKAEMMNQTDETQEAAKAFLAAAYERFVSPPDDTFPGDLPSREDAP